MIDPYRMIVINIIASSVLFLGILIYKFIYPKRNLNPIFLIILLSLLPLISILRKGSYESGDLSLHVKMAMSFYDTLKDGNIIPRWSTTLCTAYGCPFFVFIYPLPYYFVSFFHSLGFSFLASVKSLLIFSFIGSGLAMYFWAKEEFGKTPAVVAAIFYLFAPYHLLDMHFRVAIGEVLAFMLLPLVFLASKMFIQTQRYKWFLILGFSLCLLILSHQVTSLASFPFICAYGLFLWKQKKHKKFKDLIHFSISLIFGIVLSSFYLIPVLFETRYVQFTHLEVELLNLWSLIYSPWRYGFLFQGQHGELSPIIGYIQLLIVLLAVVLLIKHKIDLEKNKLLIFFLISFFIIFLIVQTISKPFWDIAPLVKNFQFSYRLLLLISFFTSAIAAVIVKKFRKKSFIYILCFLAIFPTILNWGNRRSIAEINDSYLKKESILESSFPGSPLNPRWVDLKKSWIEKRTIMPIETISGKADIFQVSKNSVMHKYTIKTETNVTFKENTFYYPGWSLKINGAPYPFEYTNPKYPGVIIFDLPKGIYKAEVVFTDTPLRSFSKKLSFLALICLFLYPLFNKKFMHK